MKKYENFCSSLGNMKDIYNYEEPYDNVVLTGLVGLYEITFEQSWKMMKEILQNHGYEEGHPLRYLIFRFPAILRTHQPRWTVERTDRHAGGPPDHSHGRRHAVRHRAAGAWLRYGFDND